MTTKQDQPFVNWSLVSQSLWFWIMRLTVVALFPLLIVYEWKRWPNGSQWLGPFGLMWYSGGEFHVAGLILGLLLIVVSLGFLFAFLIKPHPITALISMLGVINWTFWGMVAEGIGC